MRARRRWELAAALVAGTVLVVGCSSTGANTGSGTASGPATAPLGSTVTGGTVKAAVRPTCERPAAPAPAAKPVDGVASDIDVTSFDGTTIRAHWFPLATASAAAPAPTVLMGPGWSLAGDTDADAVGVLGAINISSLRNAGFNVLTWDPRGFGKSTGSATVNSADFEGRDVQALLDWTAAQPGVQVDRAGDPRVGMIGGSYGGGIQLTTAAIDCRVDAIVPVIAWHSLQTSLYKADTVKSGWSGILVSVAKSRSVDPHVDHAYTSGKETGVLDADDKAWFIARGPADLVGKITIPTLVVQGTVDTLFTLDEGVTNYGILKQSGVPVSMLWFCGGHGACLTNPGDEARVGRAGIAWLKRYVQNDTSVDTGPRFDFVDQNGTRYTADDYPIAAGTPITAHGSGTLALTATGGAGPAKAPDSKEMLASLVLPVTPARATNAVDVPIDLGSKPAVIVGAPEVTLTYSGTSPAGDKPTRLFAQLVDEATGLVLGNQITPIAVTLDGQAHTATVPLEIVAFTVTPGTKLTLQLVATTVAYAEPRLGGSVEVSAVDISLPTGAGLTPAAP